MSHVYLRVKIKSLAAEAKIIRHEERRFKPRISHDDQTYFGLRDHRIFVVRAEARATQIAYGFLRGRSYAQIEPVSKRAKPDWSKVEKMVAKYGGMTTDQAKVALIEWREKRDEQPTKKAA